MDGVMGISENVRNRILAEIDQLFDALKVKDTQIESLSKELADTQWYWGEKSARCEELEKQLQGKNAYVQKMEEELGALRKRYEESEWYLGEERNNRTHLEQGLNEAQSKAQNAESQLNAVRAELEEVKKQLAEAQWYLGEEKAKNNK
jgi:chromosome segregation ATPase